MKEEASPFRYQAGGRKTIAYSEKENLSGLTGDVIKRKTTMKRKIHCKQGNREGSTLR